jgi:hypothetical protein
MLCSCDQRLDQVTQAGTNLRDTPCEFQKVPQITRLKRFLADQILIISNISSRVNNSGCKPESSKISVTACRSLAEQRFNLMIGIHKKTAWSSVSMAASAS